MGKRAKALGKELVRLGIITNEQLNEVLKDIDGKSIVRAITEKGFASEAAIAKALAQAMGYEFVELSNIQIDPNAVALVPEEIQRKHTVIPFALTGNTLKVAIADPSNVVAIDDIKLITSCEVEAYVATETEILNAIDQFSRLDSDVKEIADVGGEEFYEDELKVKEEAESEDAPIVKLVNAILTEGVRARASDITVEPQEDEVRVRYRIDGVYHEVMKLAKSTQLGVITRIKIMAGLDIAEKRVPQDGRISLLVDGKTVDFRVATFPTIYGEASVLRILEKGSIALSLEELGFLPEQLEIFKKSIIKPWGAILVTGPTGSGKTTTLYSALNMINSVEKNIITVEDPVEYRLEGINQVQVNPKAGLTFASALRSILRNDPDIIMIGEIRDVETALIAIESALTGHLVLSTLHTNNSASVFTRLIEMGIEPFLISSAIDCVLAQRLARKLCPHCKEPYKPDKDFLKSVGFADDDIDKIDVLYSPRGCDYCAKTGFRGRTGLYEVLVNSESIRELVLAKASADEIMDLARKEGMVTMVECGLKKAMAGETCIEEVFRVIS
jgi:type IV pilus assembly protein PilB